MSVQFQTACRAIRPDVKKNRDRLPQQITEQLKAGTALVKEAKGLGSSR